MTKRKSILIRKATVKDAAARPKDLGSINQCLCKMGERTVAQIIKLAAINSHLKPGSASTRSIRRLFITMEYITMNC